MVRHRRAFPLFLIVAGISLLLGATIYALTAGREIAQPPGAAPLLDQLAGLALKYKTVSHSKD